MSFGERLRELREKNGLTQEELGEKINQKKANISKYETGRLQPSLETINLLAAIFNVTTDYLLGRTDNPNDVNYEPTPQELEKVLREANIAFDGSPLDEEDKEDVIEFVKVALRALKKRNREKAQEKATDHQ